MRRPKQIECSLINLTLDRIQETKKNLIQSISSAANPGAPIPAEEGFYSAISGMNRVHDNIQNSSDFKANISKLSRSNTGASNYSEKLRNKFEIKKRLKRIFELEAKKKYMNSSSYFKLNVAGDDERFERNLVGRKFKKMDGDEVFEFSLEFLKRNLKYKRAKKIGMSGLRVDPELSQLIDVKIPLCFFFPKNIFIVLIFLRVWMNSTKPRSMTI